MKEERNCKIVQDLLPNYIDGLTNEETNLFIEEHLKECSNCKQVFENMKQDFNIKNNAKDSREVKYIKKFNNRLKMLKAIIAIILVVSLSVMMYYYNYFKKAYLGISNQMVKIVQELEQNDIEIHYDSNGEIQEILKK